MLVDMTRMFNDKDSFQDPTGYIEAIQEEDKKLEKFFRVQEWWARLAEQYYLYPEELKRHHQENFKVIDKWMTLRDPDYDPEEAEERRARIRSELLDSMDAALATKDQD
jgi:hypothetical protein